MVGPRRLMAQSAAVKSPVFSYRFNQVRLPLPRSAALALLLTSNSLVGYAKHVDGYWSTSFL